MTYVPNNSGMAQNFYNDYHQIVKQQNNQMSIQGGGAGSHQYQNIPQDGINGTQQEQSYRHQAPNNYQQFDKTQESAALLSNYGQAQQFPQQFTSQFPKSFVRQESHPKINGLVPKKQGSLEANQFHIGGGTYYPQGIHQMNGFPNTFENYQITNQDQRVVMNRNQGDNTYKHSPFSIFGGASDSSLPNPYHTIFNTQGFKFDDQPSNYLSPQQKTYLQASQCVPMTAQFAEDQLVANNYRNQNAPTQVTYQNHRTPLPDNQVFTNQEFLPNEVQFSSFSPKDNFNYETQITQTQQEKVTSQFSRFSPQIKNQQVNQHQNFTKSISPLSHHPSSQQQTIDDVPVTQCDNQQTHNAPSPQLASGAVAIPSPQVQHSSFSVVQSITQTKISNDWHLTQTATQPISPIIHQNQEEILQKVPESIQQSRVVSELPLTTQSFQNLHTANAETSKPNESQINQSLQSKQEHIGNEIDLYRILDGIEDRTTVMIRNIPNKFKQRTLLDMINECHIGQYNYFYLPMDLKTQCNVGYAFINFIHPIYIMDFFLEFQSVEWHAVTSDCKSSKISGLAFANIQGQQELISHHCDKNIMKKAEDYIKPVIVDEDKVLKSVMSDSKELKLKYKAMIESGNLDRQLLKLSKMQKRALTTNGPHPHYNNSLFQPFAPSSNYQFSTQGTFQRKESQQSEASQSLDHQDDYYYQYYDEQQQTEQQDPYHHDTYYDDYYNDEATVGSTFQHMTNGGYYRQTASAKYRSSHPNHRDEDKTKKPYYDQEATTSSTYAPSKYQQSRGNGAGDFGASSGSYSLQGQNHYSQQKRSAPKNHYETRQTRYQPQNSNSSFRRGGQGGGHRGDARRQHHYHQQHTNNNNNYYN